MFLPIDEKQFNFRKLRRDRLATINISRLFNISRQALSGALISMDKRIEITLLEMADRMESIPEEDVFIVLSDSKFLWLIRPVSMHNHSSSRGSGPFFGKRDAARKTRRPL